MNLFTIALKDLTRSLRSLFAVGMMVAAPLMIVGLIYFAFGGMSSGETAKIADVRVAVVNLDTPPAGQDALGGQLLSMLQDERMPDWLLASPYDSEAAARSAVQRQEIAAAVIVPADFTAQLMSADGHTELRLIHDPTLSISPTILRLLLTQYADTVSAMRVAVNVLPEPSPQAVQPLVSSYSAWLTAFLNNLNHSPEPYLQVLSPAQQQDSTSATTNPMARVLGLIFASQLVFFSFYTGAYSATSFLTEQEEGTLQRLFTTPIPRAVILGGKFLSVFVLCVLQAAVLLTAGRLAFGQGLTVAAVVAAQVAAAGGFGILLISFIKSSRQSGPVLGGGLTVMGMLGGLFTAAVPNPPAFMNLTGRLVPQGWAFTAWKQALNGASLMEALPAVGVLFAMGAVCFAVGAWLFNRRFSAHTL
ncbi:ABC transporter permease [Levilinea saccharolytica]|uniref:ABC-2 type transporter transmembrane domain-containing protein n=1 Tax=Levilinea saccharolytica TaxID=229921 RepID=A0A0P6XWA8_9CHLR|nr:ABC transporter permease [Levilinea saccharolytica]KPL79735.1 hypothetical protein ADN01_13675 [Levilinea saccharolytica]GAP16944.1 ABC-2 family transporter protein [Levilinea saccharolytica]